MIENDEIARLLDETADSLEFEGANEFRVRAYRRAARTIRELPEPAARLSAKAGRKLEELPGIGADLAGKVRTIAQTGGFPLLSELRARIPAGLQELMSVPGLGAKKVQALYRALGVSSVAELEKAAAAGRIRTVEGFGAKSERMIVAGIQERQGSLRRLLLSRAAPYVRTLLSRLRRAPGVGAAEAAGSFRRRRETVGDLDFVAARILWASNSTSTVFSAAGGAWRDAPRPRSTRHWGCLSSRPSYARGAAR